MTLPKHIRTLAAAALLATAVSLTAGPAHAEQNQGASDQPTLCASYNKQTKEWDFHAPGGTVSGTYTRTNANGPYVEEGANGKKYECRDGNWHEVKDAVVPPGLGGKVIGHVLGQSGSLPVLHEVPATNPTVVVAPQIGVVGR